MGKLTLGKVVRTVGKISREIERERKRLEREQNKRLREIERREKARERERAKLLREQERELKRREKENEKIKKEANKKRVKVSAEAKRTFSIQTVREHGLGKRFSSSNHAKDISFNLDSELALLKSEKISVGTKKIKGSTLDQYLYTGRLNSVLGLDGMKVFRNGVLELVDSPSADISLPLGKLEELVFSSGIYFEYEFTSAELRKIEDASRWKSFYRMITLKSDVKKLSEVSLESLKKEFPVYFRGFELSDFDDLRAVTEIVARDLKIELEEFLGKVVINQFVA